MIRIVTDSGANLTPEMAREHRIEVVPLTVLMGGKPYKEGIELQAREFYERLPHVSPSPTTSQPSPADFEAVYRPILEAGDEIITVTLSSKLSGTYNSALQGAKAIDEKAPVSVVDSWAASGGEAMLAIAGAQAAAAGASRTDIVRMLEDMARQMLLVIALDTLEYLRRGGRIGGAQAFIGGLLRIKPVIFLKEGKVEAGDRARNRRKAIERLIEMEYERFGNQPVWLAAMHTAAEADMKQMAQEAAGRLNVQKTFYSEVGPVVGTHIGPNGLGLAAIPAPKL